MKFHKSVSFSEGTVSELLLYAGDFTLQDGWLKVDNNHFRLGVDRSRINQVWLVRDSDSMRTVCLIDYDCEPLLDLSLLCPSEGLASSVEAGFNRAWRDLSKVQPPKKSST